MSDYSKTYNGASKDSANDTVLGADFDSEFSLIQTAVNSKADKIASATNGNIIEQDANGNLVDSGVATATVSTAITNAAQKPTLETALSCASGTEKDFTSIPSWVTQIDVLLEGVSIDTIDDIIIQIGDSGGFETSGYISGGQEPTTPTTDTATTGFQVFTTGGGAGIDYGVISLFKFSPTSNLWIAKGMQWSPNLFHLSAGYKELTGALDRVRLTTKTGTTNFDAGNVNIRYS